MSPGRVCAAGRRQDPVQCTLRPVTSHHVISIIQLYSNTKAEEGTKDTIIDQIRAFETAVHGMCVDKYQATLRDTISPMTFLAIVRGWQFESQRTPALLP